MKLPSTLVLATSIIILTHATNGDTIGLVESSKQHQAAISELRKDVSPVASITAYVGKAEKVPAGWLLCDGRLIKIPDQDDPYFALFEAIGFTFGGSAEDGVFAIPDLRGMSLIRMSEMATKAAEHSHTRPADIAGYYLIRY